MFFQSIEVIFNRKIPKVFAQISTTSQIYESRGCITSCAASNNRKNAINMTLARERMVLICGLQFLIRCVFNISFFKLRQASARLFSSQFPFLPRSTPTLNVWAKNAPSSSQGEPPPLRTFSSSVFYGTTNCKWEAPCPH